MIRSRSSGASSSAQILAPCAASAPRAATAAIASSHTALAMHALASFTGSPPLNTIFFAKQCLGDDDPCSEGTSGVNAATLGEAHGVLPASSDGLGLAMSDGLGLAMSDGRGEAIKEGRGEAVTGAGLGARLGRDDTSSLSSGDDSATRTGLHRGLSAASFPHCSCNRYMSAHPECSCRRSKRPRSNDHVPP
jgi:hypothetical protein